MKLKILIIFAFSLLIYTYAPAQVQINAPASLSNRNASKSKTKTPPAEPTTPPAEPTTAPEPPTEQPTTPDPLEQYEQSETLPPADINITDQRAYSSSQGWRIQCYSDNNAKKVRDVANSRAREIAYQFPLYRAYITYRAPMWRLRIGDFRSRSQAEQVLKKMRKAFPKISREMTIVRDRINLWR